MTVRSQKQPQQLKQKPAQKSSKAVGTTTKVAHGEEVGIPLHLLVPYPDNVRQRKSDRKSIERLARNIKAEGLLQNLVVIEGKKCTFEVVAGERRLAALLGADRGAIGGRSSTISE